MQSLHLSHAERRQLALAVLMAGALAFCVGLFAQSQTGSQPAGASAPAAASGQPDTGGQTASAGQDAADDVFEGWASWYGAEFHGRTMSNGEIFDRTAYTAAHRTLPFDTMVLVTNLDNGASIVVRITDRGPFVKGRVIDLSEAAANILGMLPAGVAHVRCRVLRSEEAAAFGLPGRAPDSKSRAAAPSGGAAAGADGSAAAGSISGSGAAQTGRSARVQVASYSVLANAEGTCARLRASGLNPAVETAGSHHRVVFADIPEASVPALVQKLKSLGYLDLLIVYSSPAGQP